MQMQLRDFEAAVDAFVEYAEEHEIDIEAFDIAEEDVNTAMHESSVAYNVDIEDHDRDLLLGLIALNLQERGVVALW